MSFIKEESEGYPEANRMKHEDSKDKTGLWTFLILH